MTKKAKPKLHTPLGKRIIAGLNDALAHAKGEPSGVVLHAPAALDKKSRKGAKQ